MSTSTVTKARRPVRASDDYLELVKEFPLRPINTRTQFKAAGAILDRLVGREDLTEGQSDYLAGLAMFVEAYEKKAFPELHQKADPIDVLRLLMESNEMNTSELGEIIGGRGVASEVLNGKRSLSKAMIRKLSERFGVGADVFLA